MNLLPKTPFFLSSISPSKIQKPESKMTTFPVLKSRLQRRIIKPIVFPLSWCIGFGSSFGLSFPSTISSAKRMPLSPLHIVWYSFPNGWGFLGQNTQPGLDYLLYQILMLSSRQLTQEGVKICYMLLLNLARSLRTSQKRPVKGGGKSFV